MIKAWIFNDYIMKFTWSLLEPTQVALGWARQPNHYNFLIIRWLLKIKLPPLKKGGLLPYALFNPY